MWLRLLNKNKKSKKHKKEKINLGAISFKEVLQKDIYCKKIKVQGEIVMNINLNTSKIKTIKLGDELYPEKLKNIHMPPKTLYLLGNEQVLKQRSMAIIGCRDCTKYGAENAYKFAYELATKDICVISGLAKGIDAYAHLGAVKAKGKTIAVLGSGLDIIYPSENAELYKKIIKNDGAIITEYPLGSKPEKYHFPERNRIISGISDGVLVVEARKKSGTMITVDFALEQGREVYAIPGNISSDSSYGTNELIKEGAIPVTSINDIIFNRY